MKISVVIPTYNRSLFVHKCIQSLIEQDFKQDEFEIIVVSDGSTDDTRQIVGQFTGLPTVILLEQENAGLSSGRNAGALAASGEIVLFLDDDVICAPGLLTAHHTAHMGRTVVVVGGFRSCLSDKARLGEMLIHDGITSEVVVAGVLDQWPDSASMGLNCSMQRDLFMEVGGYDRENFARYTEDIEIGWRIAKLDIIFWREPGAVVTHSYDKSDSQFIADASAFGAAMVRLCRKHPELRTHVRLAKLVAGNRYRLAIARFLATGHYVFEPLLSIACSVLYPSRRTRFKPIVIKLMGVRSAISFWHGAICEAGSWNDLIRLMTGHRL